jgi:hypothetical protein
MDLQLPLKSLPITTKIVSLNPIHGEVYSIKHYVIKFVSDLPQVCGFLWVNENNWFAESRFFVGVHWMEFVSHVRFRQLQTQR